MSTLTFNLTLTSIATLTLSKFKNIEQEGTDQLARNGVQCSWIASDGSLQACQSNTSVCEHKCSLSVTLRQV